MRALKARPWFGSAGDMLGIAYLQQGKRDLAAAIFAAMAKDDTVPQSIRRRALQVARIRGHVAHLVAAPAQLAPQRADHRFHPAYVRGRVVGYEQDSHRLQTRMRPIPSKIQCWMRRTASAG